MKRPTIALLFIILFTGGILSQSVNQWRGPDRTGIYPETGLLAEWPKEGPPLLWTADKIGKGFSSPVADGNAIYITGIKDTTDYLTALNLEGKIIWQVPFGPSWTNSFPDTRITPTIENNSIYVLSGSGTLACINTYDGKIKWSFDAVKKFEGAYGEWGIAESPLMVDDKVIYTPGGPKTTMVALNKMTGETIWQSVSLDDSSAYVSPRLIQYGNKKIIITLINKYFLGVDANNGKILWKYEYSALYPEQSLKIWPGAPKTNTITPLYKDGFIYITGGYNHVGAMFKLSDDASSVSLVWTDTTLDCHHGGVVLLDGYIYGSNWIDNGRGNWCCIDWKTGKTLYEQTWHTKGSIISADGLLYCYEEKGGNVGLVRPSPEKFELISSFKVPHGKGPYWAHPEIRKGILYIRHGDAIMAYDLRKNR